MAGSFSGIEIASRAMQTSQGLIQVIGQNIANVNTPGYSRQTAVVQATDPDTEPGRNATNVAQWGTGVEITAIRRVHDAMLHQRINSTLGEGSRQEELAAALGSAQALYSEPGSGGISDLLTGFFNAFGALAANPESSAARNTVLQSATNLARQFNRVAAGLDALAQDVGKRVAGAVKEANKAAEEIADLNRDIRIAVAAGQQPNDLMDRRDNLVKQLAGLVGATASEERTSDGRSTGVVNVSLNGTVLVQGSDARALPSTFTAANGQGILGTGRDAVAVTGGTLGGMLAAVDTLGGYRSEMDQVAATLVREVNALHRTGNGLDGLNNRDFFAGTSAATIAVSASVRGNPSAIAAATAPLSGQTAAAGNGGNARLIAKLVDKAVFGSDTIVGKYNAHVASVGADVQDATDAASTSKAVGTQLDTLRSSVEGVSLDEELTRMLEYQRSYQAAARMLSAMDSLLETLIQATRG
jgi:flagellar hook-associated protein 1 FlgK